MSSPLVAHLIAGSTDGNSFTSGSIDTTGATLLVACIVNTTGSAAISDSKSNTWSPLTAKTTGSTITGQIFYCANPSVGSGHTFTATVGASTAPNIQVLAFNATLASPFDQQNSGGGGGVTLSAGSVTPTQNGEIVVTFVGSNNLAGATFALNCAVVVDVLAGVSGQHFSGASAFVVQDTAAAITPTWFLNASSTLIVAVVATFKASVPTAAGVNRSLLPAGVSALG